MMLHYPTVDDLCCRAAGLGVGCMGYKHDMDRAFKTNPGIAVLMATAWHYVGQPVPV